MLRPLGDHNECHQCSDNEGHHATSREADQDRVAHQGGGTKRKSLAPPSSSLQAEEESHAEACDHGDGDGVIVHAAETVFVHAVEAAVISLVHLQAHVTQAKDDYPRKLLQLSN